MKFLKKLVMGLSPDFYFFLRDRYHFSRLKRDNGLIKIAAESNAVSDFDSALKFTDRYLKSYQIKSEINGLITLLSDFSPETFVEIGTADGGTHYLIRKLVPSIQKSVAIDTDIKNKLLLEYLLETPNSNYIVGSSRATSTLKSLEQYLSGDSIDVLFIDGDHSYEGVKHDFHMYQKLVRKNGVIVFHDIVEDWGKRYGRKTNKYTGGVPQFFDEIKAEYEHYEFIDDPEQDGFGIGVLRQK